MAGRFTRGRVVRGVRRLTDWFFLDFSETTIAGATAVLVGSLNAVALAARPFTVVRTHIHLKIQSDQAAASESQFAAFGMAVVSDQAVAVGVTAVPTPATDQTSDWFAHRWLSGNAVNLTDQTVGSRSYDLDSKAMRKVEQGSDIIIVLENAIATGCVIGMAGRFLIKTH